MNVGNITLCIMCQEYHRCPFHFFYTVWIRQLIGFFFLQHCLFISQLPSNFRVIKVDDSFDIYNKIYTGVPTDSGLDDRGISFAARIKNYFIFWRRSQMFHRCCDVMMKSIVSIVVYIVPIPLILKLTGSCLEFSLRPSEK